jgi:hypothetical protein
MKYTKKLQILLELNKINGNIVSVGSFNFFDCSIKKQNNNYYLNISPKFLGNVDSSLYKIDLGSDINKINININKINIDEILNEIKSQAEHLSDSENRMENIKNIQNDEKFKKELETELKNLIENAKNLKQAA